tara:strand:+ start:253 stop:717 length:465 start_codon:yes stop_codon:yes gene_type:complete
MDYYLDKTIQIKCLKEKKGNRTYIYGLYKYFDSIDECDLFSDKMKKFLATSMEIKDEEEENLKNKKVDEIKLNNEKINDIELNNEESDKESNNEILENIDNDNSKRRKKKKKETVKKIVVINKPIYTFRGDLIRKITDYLKNNLNNYDSKNIIS